MRLTPLRPFRSTHPIIPQLNLRRAVLCRGTTARSRKLLCLTVVLSLVILPAPGLAHEVRLLSSSLTVDVTTGSVRVVSWLVNMIFGTQNVPAEGSEDRLAQVRTIRISPSRFVGYPGESVSFQAIGRNFVGETIQGVIFDDWDSSETSVQVDDSGRARFLRAGLATITCRAGAAVAIAQVLVRPGQRPRQTDQEWKIDQDSLPDPEPGGIGRMLPSLIDKLMPTAHAQGGGYTGADFGYNELWSESRNLAGSPRNRAIEPTGLGPVLPEGSNFSFAVPIIALGGRGIGASLSLYYNSRVWTRHGNAVTFSGVGGFPFAGFSIGFGRILTYGPTATTTYVLVDPDGTRHWLGTGNAGVNTTYVTSDGSHITFVSSTAWGTTTIGGTLYYNDGTQVSVTLYNNRLLPIQVKDSNGNYVGISYKYGVAVPLAIDFVTDTQGRKIQFNYNSPAGNLISITAPGYGGTAQNPVTRTVAQFDYQGRTLSYNFTGLTVENTPTGAVNMLRHVYFPAAGTGALYSYSDYGMIYYVSSRRQMTIDGNGVISDGVESANVSFNYPTSGSTALSDVPSFTQRTEMPGSGPSGVFSYSTTPGLQAVTYNVARPDSSTLLLTRSTNGSSIANGLLTQTEIKNSGGSSMSKSVMTYANDPGGSVQPQSVIGYDDTNTPVKVDFDYDAYGNVVNKREYGFQSSGAWQVRRRASASYSTDTNYTSRYLRSLVTETKVYNALQNTNDADDVLIGKTAFVLDDYAATGGMEDYGGSKPPNWDAAYPIAFIYRGNITGVTRWIDTVAGTTLLTRLRKYDKLGNVLQEQVSCCKQKVFTYVQDDYWAEPPTVTNGDPQGLHLTAATTYDFNTGLPKYTEFANLGKRWFFYDAALRIIQQDLPTGGSDTATYDDANMTASFTKVGHGTKTLGYDGFGRTIQAVDANNGQVNTSYDTMGRVESQTNPFAGGARLGLRPAIPTTRSAG